MRKNRKKIIGTLLGLMASISNAGATVQSAPNTGSANTETTNEKNEKQNKFKKRVEAKASIGWLISKTVIEFELLNELCSTIPGLRKCSRTLVRPYFSNYRIVHGFRGYVMRHDNPTYTDSVFKLNGDDGHDFRVRVDKADNFFKVDNDNKLCKNLPVESTLIIDDLNVDNCKFKLSEYLSEPSLNLVAEAEVQNENKNEDKEYYRLFDDTLSIYKTIWDIEDVANAVGKANKLLDIINNQGMNAEQKKKMIEKQFGENVVFVPEKKEEKKKVVNNAGGDNGEYKFRILLGKKKFPIVDLREIVEEKFFAGKLQGANVELGIKNENNQEVIQKEINRLKGVLDKLDKSQGLNCYAEFKLVKGK